MVKNLNDLQKNCFLSVAGRLINEQFLYEVEKVEHDIILHTKWFAKAQGYLER